MKQLTCIICPRGCSLQIDKLGNEYVVTGQMCKRGKDFAINEMVNPTRSVTSTVRTIYPDFPRLPIKTDGEIPLDKIFDVMKALKAVLVDHYAGSGEIIIENISGTGINIVSTIDMSLCITAS